MSLPTDILADHLDSRQKSTSTGAQKGSSITRVLDILESVATSNGLLTPAELGESLGIPKATIHRLCATLEAEGFLQTRMSGRGLLPGHRYHRCSLGVLASSPYRAQRHAILSKLSEDIGETCNISIPDGTEMLYFDRVETHWPVRIQLQVGSRVPVYCTASGKMYLSTLPPAKRRRILSNSHLAGLTANTITDLDQLEQELEDTYARGYATDNEEFIEGMVALAVPVRDTQGRLYATVSFNAPVMRIAFSMVESYLPLLLAAGEQLSELLED